MRNWQAQPRGGARIGKRANSPIYYTKLHFIHDFSTTCGMEFLEITNQNIFQLNTRTAEQMFTFISLGTFFMRNRPEIMKMVKMMKITSCFSS